MRSALELPDAPEPAGERLATHMHTCTLDNVIQVFDFLNCKICTPDIPARETFTPILALFPS